MEHNIPLMARVLDQITRHPDTHDQSTWCNCIAGWAVRLAGGYVFRREPGSLRDGIEVLNTATGTVEDIETVAARLLGLWDEEAKGLFAATDTDAVHWLEDIIVTHQTKTLDQLAQRVDEAVAA
ncbi:hypothetical protein [Nocardia otitidiscaviarum]|uniref:hypothetical protein n=1 Tax=Nocardia otitidiscaviarum TaxID=1823 RepID=UPI0004A7285F|nr:hypothetical protein [Nocardia otitidiscaviarum]